jgi:hypothetical protein
MGPLVELLPDRVADPVRTRGPVAAATQALPDFVGSEISLKRVVVVAGWLIVFWHVRWKILQRQLSGAENAREVVVKFFTWEFTKR